MKRSLLLFVCLITFLPLNAQIITTFAGTGGRVDTFPNGHIAVAPNGANVFYFGRDTGTSLGPLWSFICYYGRFYDGNFYFNVLSNTDGAETNSNSLQFANMGLFYISSNDKHMHYFVWEQNF